MYEKATEGACSIVATPLTVAHQLRKVQSQTMYYYLSGENNTELGSLLPSTGRIAHNQLT